MPPQWQHLRVCTREAVNGWERRCYFLERIQLQESRVYCPQAIRRLSLYVQLTFLR